jgi:hypothetical protein
VLSVVLPPQALSKAAMQVSGTAKRLWREKRDMAVSQEKQKGSANTIKFPHGNKLLRGNYHPNTT